MNDQWFHDEAKKVNRLRSELRLAKASVVEERAVLRKSKLDLETALQAQALLSVVAEDVQRRVHSRISKVVSSCLEAVFDNSYQFQIEFQRKRGRTEARMKFVRDGQEIDPMDSSGGGTVDVAAFALRAACLVMHRPRLRRVLFLDEPFKFVSSRYQDAVRSMLEQLAEDLKIQIVMVTHNEAYETGKVVEIE